MFGLLRKAAAAIDRHVGVSVSRTYLYRRTRPAGWSAAAAADSGIGWELLSPERVARLQDIGSFDVSDGLERLRRGELCYTVWIEGRLAHYTWVQVSGSHPISKAGVCVPVLSGEFWLYNGRTGEWARKRGILRATLERIINDHFAAGYSTALAYAAHWNTPSQKGMARAGFTYVRTLTALRVGSHYFRLGRANRCA